MGVTDKFSLLLTFCVYYIIISLSKLKRLGNSVRTPRGPETSDVKPGENLRMSYKNWKGGLRPDPCREVVGVRGARRSRLAWTQVSRRLERRDSNTLPGCILERTNVSSIAVSCKGMEEC